MPTLELHVISLRYSSWSIRALLPLLHAKADLSLVTAELDMARQGDPVPDQEVDAYLRAHSAELAHRRSLGSVTGLFPVLRVDGTPIHEALAIAEWTAEHFPDAGLWPAASLQRARARALSAEMAGGFRNIRNHMSCHGLARVPGFVPDGPTRTEIARVFELMDDSLQRSGGPYLFGDFGIVDAMYFPVMTRLSTYGIALPDALTGYASALEEVPAVQRWRQLALQAPAIPVYDDYIRSLGGALAPTPA